VYPTSCSQSCPQREWGKRTNLFLRLIVVLADFIYSMVLKESQTVPSVLGIIIMGREMIMITHLITKLYLDRGKKLRNLMIFLQKKQKED